MGSAKKFTNKRNTISKRIMAFALSLLMIMSVMPSMSFLPGGGLMKVLAEEGDEYTLDLSPEGNGSAENPGWDDKNSYYEYVGAEGADNPYVQANGVFGYYSTGGKIRVYADGSKIMLNGTPINTGQATIQIETPQNELGWDMELIYTAKGNKAEITYGILNDTLMPANSSAGTNASKSDAATYITKLDGGKKYIIGANNGMNVKGLKISKIYQTTITGNVSCVSGTTLPESSQIIFKEVTGVDENGKAIEYGATYTSTNVVASTGSYSVELPASSIAKQYEVVFSDGSYIFSPELGLQSITKETSTINAAVQKVSSYTLTGSYTTGLDGVDVSKVTGLTFTAITDSSYEVPAPTLIDGTYSVRLEKGTTYTITAEGVNDYDVTTEAITYSEDTECDISFAKKAAYPVTLKFGAAPDLAAMNNTYEFTHLDGNVYSFSDVSSISLRDGTYTLTINGDFEKVPYAISDGGNIIVSGAGVTQTVKFNAVNSWSFAGSGLGVYSKNIQGTVGYFNGLKIDAASGKVVPNGIPANSAQFTTGAIIKVPVSGKCSITVNAYQASYALYTIGGNPASVDNISTTYDYTGEAGTVDIVSTGSAYIASISIVYPAKEVEFVEQPIMPSIAGDDADSNTDTDSIPRASKSDSLVVQPEGQKLNMVQTGGSVSESFERTANIGYYLFPLTTDKDSKLEFDVVVTDATGTTTSQGFFGGIFTNNYIYSIGLRSGGTNVRGIYSKNASSFAGAGSPDGTITLNTPVHYEITFASGKPSVKVSYYNADGLQVHTWSQGMISEDDTSNVYFGFALAQVSATISNMVYTDSSGVKYDQNACYYPAGTAPVAAHISATAAESREYIDIAWEGSIPEGDGTYTVEMQRNDGQWEVIATDLTTLTYRHVLENGQGGTFKFRVCGQLGKGALGGTKNDYVTMSETIDVLAALTRPVVTTTAAGSSIALSWEAIDGAASYEVYRYSYDEGMNAQIKIAGGFTDTTYVDGSVTAEVPYYYLVKAVADGNESPLSEVVWDVATSGHSGEYVYEDEATEIYITKKSYDTVFKNTVVIEGNVYGAGSLAAQVNDTVVGTKNLTAGQSFSFNLTVNEGRNDVNLLFTDSNGKTTRKTFNFVYLTKYDVLVDSSYSGTDGGTTNGVPTYKTVQAAVNSIDSSNESRKVILVLAGSYEERLVVNTPNISIIGEDRESTSIHYYPGVLGAAYEAGGDMDKRCAVYIQSGAEGFTAENISLANDYVYATADGKSNKSADALRNEADNSAFVNVKLSGVQDTLYMHSGKQYYYKCRIEGLVDYIYSGDKARAFFNDCELVFVYESTKTSGYVCAPKTEAAAAYGLTFYNCVITGEEGCSGTGYLLARPWGPDAYITWINCYMGKSIYATAPYGAMSGNQHQDARFFEYGTYGPGFVINTDRRQISPTAADNMVSAEYLGWNPQSTMTTLSAGSYVGGVTTNRDDMYATSAREDNTYMQTDGDDTNLSKYNMEGFTTAYGVTGGGLLKENNPNYYKVATATEFLDALVSAKASGKKSVIELTADINLGSKEVDNYGNYSSIIKAYSAQALTHPTLIESGVSTLTFNNVYNLTIFSSNASSIKHANITMKNTENVIIRNIKFDELWEWDEATAGDYDRNDWDFMTIDQNSNGIWIDHCTFYKAYDGIVDIKNPSPMANVTISWCEFLPGSENDTFFNQMMDVMKANPSAYPYYKSLLEGGMTEEQIWWYAYGQKKTHLLGQSDDATSAAGIRATFANNYYLNSMDRMPRLRYGTAHVYNCIMDAQQLYDARKSITNEEAAKHIVSNGASSTCGGQLLVENSYISGIINALNSGNGSSPAGYINAVNSLYYINGTRYALEPKVNTTYEGATVLKTDAAKFKEALTYSDYILYDASKLSTEVSPFAGAGKLTLTNLQWEKTSYNDNTWQPPVDDSDYDDDILDDFTGEVTDEQMNLIKDFVERMYVKVLNRKAETEGLLAWSNMLAGKKTDGFVTGYSLVFGQESLNRNLSNEDFLEMLYNAFLGRKSDKSGKAAWLAYLEAGIDREKVFEGFICSAEFAKLCSDAGIEAGSSSGVSGLDEILAHYRNQNINITKYVARCYSEALGRKYDVDGLEAWCKGLITGEFTPKETAEHFIFSVEMNNRNLSTKEFVKVLYRTFLGREAERSGLNAWVDYINDGHTDREGAVNGFAASIEFGTILESFGLN